jgi:hypothetical protein
LTPVNISKALPGRGDNPAAGEGFFVFRNIPRSLKKSSGKKTGFLFLETEKNTGTETLNMIR